MTVSSNNSVTHLLLQSRKPGLRKVKQRAGKKAQQSGPLAILSEDLGSIPLKQCKKLRVVVHIWDPSTPTVTWEAEMGQLAWNTQQSYKIKRDPASQTRGKVRTDQ